MKSKLPKRFLQGKKSKQKIITKYLELLEKIEESKITKPSILIKEVMHAFDNDSEENPQTRKNFAGGIFELVVCESIYREGISPFYMQTEMQFVPIAKFDVMLYHVSRPVALSLKVSLRERWKQAAFEGDKLKQIYRQAKSYLITLNEDDAIKRNKDIEAKKFVGVDEVIIGSTSEWDELLKILKEMHMKDPFRVAEKIDPIVKYELVEDDPEDSSD